MLKFFFTGFFSSWIRILISSYGFSSLIAFPVSEGYLMVLRRYRYRTKSDLCMTALLTRPGPVFAITQYLPVSLFFAERYQARPLYLSARPTAYLLQG